ncbi:hypothetical protein JCM10003_3344 [Bacteroides pyogenes JCM 10003]|nr:hypothetical protein JCM10003_3344 [Bacteroides pyogenes JCM 10003]
MCRGFFIVGFSSDFLCANIRFFTGDVNLFTYFFSPVRHIFSPVWRGAKISENTKIDQNIFFNKIYYYYFFILLSVPESVSP